MTLTDAHPTPPHTLPMEHDRAPHGRQRLPDAPPDMVVRLGLGLRRALLRLADAVTPAELALFDRTVGSGRTAMLGVVARWRIPDLLGDVGLTADELAARTGASADALHRLLRALAHDGVFRLGADGRWRNNRVSSAMRAGNGMRMRHWAMYWASRANQRAWMAVDHALRAGGGAYRKANGVGVWEWFDAHPDERACFAEAMAGLTAQSAGSVAARYPFAEVGSVCDVGGGRGLLLSEVLLRHPHLRGVVCDNAGLAPMAQEIFEARGVADRAGFVAGSFFESVPEGHDVYLLKNILHDWGDAECVRILATVRRAMRPGSRVVVVEHLLGHSETDNPAALADVMMMLTCDGGRERDAGEFSALFERAGLRAGRTFPSALEALLEAVA